MQEYWDIYDINRNKTGRTMKRNDWHMKEGDYYISVLGVVRRSDGKFLITQRVMSGLQAGGRFPEELSRRERAHWKLS